MMKLFEKIQLKARLRILILIPLFGIIYFSVQSIISKRAIAQEMQTVSQITELSTYLSAVVHEIQKERGNTAGFIGSKGTNFVEQLRMQRQLSDERIELLELFLMKAGTEHIPKQLLSKLEAGQELLSQITEMRKRISAMQVTLKPAIAYYTQINTEFLDMIALISKLSDNTEITKLIAAYSSLLMAKECAGLERAVLSNTFAANAFGPHMFKKFIELMEAQNSFMQIFHVYATSGHKSTYQKIASHEAFKQVDDLHAIAITHADTGGFNQDAKAWFATITKKIDGLKELEDLISGDMLLTSEAILATAEHSLYLSVFVSVFIIGLTIWFSIVIIRDIARQLGGEPRFAADILSKVAAGDLTLDLRKQNGELNTGLMYSVEQMILSLRKVVAEVSGGAQSLELTSNQMNTASQEMSKAANDQANSVEEISASMEEMVSMINQNANNAKSTESISGDTNVHINRISDSAEAAIDATKRIVDKITVINDIAFQTNLLALNAAVEAARAGEHGRGFAVVAQEVRKLAEKSKAAAEEIVSLAHEGLHQTQNAGKLLFEVVPRIEKVSEMVQEIAAACVEQTVGAIQINDTMQQINQITQKNISSSEELAASADEMSEQSLNLKSTISYFKLPGNKVVGNSAFQVPAPTAKKGSAEGRPFNIRNNVFMNLKDTKSNKQHKEKSLEGEMDDYMFF